MIDHKLFLEQIALLSDRIGRPLAGPTQRAYYEALSDALTSEQFLAATTLAFRKWSGEFRNWPSPQQLIELIAPVANPSLSGAEAFDQVITIAARHPASKEFATRLEDILALGSSTYRAFRAAGGFRELANVLESDLPWVRKRFVEYYESSCEHADAERAASRALSSANSMMAALVASVSSQRVMPEPAKRIAAGGSR